MKEFIKALCFCLIGAILVYVFTPEPEPAKSYDQADYEQLKNSYDEVTAEFFEYGRREDSLNRLLKAKDTVARALKNEVSIYKGRLNDSAQKIKELARQVLTLAAGEKDSLCDELAHRADVFADLYAFYRDKSDSLIVTTDSIISVYRRDSYEQSLDYNRLFIAYNDLFEAFKKLQSDESKLRNSLRRQKIKTKIVALLGVLGTGAALLK